MSSAILTTSRLVRRFIVGPETIAAVDGVDLSFEPGETFALVGPSGSGKSTLLHLMAGLDRPTEGEVRVAGVTLATMSGRELADHRRLNVGIVFQFFGLLEALTSIENIEMPGVLGRQSSRTRQARAMELLSEVGLAHRAHHPVNRLSGGEQQRVAIARALWFQPKVILADEPTGNLDSEASEQIVTLLSSMAGQRAACLGVATHSWSIAARMDRVIHLRDGKVADTLDLRTVSTTTEDRVDVVMDWLKATHPATP